MAELVAGAFLTVAFEKLFKLLASPEVRSFFQGKKSVDDKLELLKEYLKRANLLLNDAEERQITDQQVKEWLDDLKDVIFKSDDLLEEINEKSRPKQVERESGCSMMVVKKMFAFLRPSTKFDKTVQGEVENILNGLHVLLERTEKTLHLKHIDGAQTIKSSRRSLAPLLEEGFVHGRQDDKAEILKLLLSDENWGSKIGVLPIVGMGGLGKTTLARLVYDDDRVKNHFSPNRAWVTVSTEFDISRITKIILEQVSRQTPVSEEPAVLQERLKEALKGEKFLFVLDDVWDENYSNWDSLKSSFTSGNCGSRIIVTTRSQKVASNVRTRELIHELRPVSNEDCWKIFVHHAFKGDSVVDSHLQQIGKKIVEKCKGLPLAVRSLGGHLCSERNPEVWKGILRSRVWSERLHKDILPALWLSYCCLPSSLKQCFAYCSVFPKDYRIKKEDTIWLWMAEGFLQSDEKDKTMEEVGRDYFDELVARSLLQRSSQDESTFVMHDLVHDLAMFVSGEFCFRFDGTMHLEQLTKRTRYLSTDGRAIDPMFWKGQFEAKHLRSFITLSSSYQTSSFHEKLVQEVLEGGRCLRVLFLQEVLSHAERGLRVPFQAERTEIQMLYNSFNMLKHLRYLNLRSREIEELPCSICTLYNLQTLSLSGCENLTQLPKDMGRLIHLRHLDITGTHLHEMPPQMANLKELQTLTDFVVGEHGNGIEELGALQHLRGKLQISGLENVDNIRRANYLTNKEKLNELALVWNASATVTGRAATEALRALQPHTDLTKLSISSYLGSNFPDWLGDSSFSKMVSIYLSGNEYCLILPPLGQLPSLRELVIESFHGVEKIGPEFYTADNSSISPFQSLEILNFSDMRSWKEWSFIGQDGKEDGCFPRLKKLSFCSCPNVAGSLSKCDTIESLEICDSYKLMESLPLDDFPKLKKLVLKRCESLKELIVDSPDVIETLDIKGCKKLQFPGSHHYVHVKELEIDCGCDSMKTLPLDYFPRLEKLRLGQCQNLESLSFTEETCIALHSLSIAECNKLDFPGSHHYVHVKELMIGNGCDSMKTLPLDYFPRLEKLRLERCQNLESLTFTEETCIALQSLTIHGCKNLRSLPEHMHGLLPSLSEMALLDCPEIEAFPKGGLPSNLNALYIRRCCNLVAQSRHWNLQGLTSLRELNIRYCKDIMLDSFPEGLLPSSLTSFSLWSFPHLKSLNGSAFQNVTCLQKLDLWHCKELQLLPREVLLPVSLRSLWIIGCPFLERRYQEGKGEDWHQISHIPDIKIRGDTTRALKRNKEEGSTSTNV